MVRVVILSLPCYLSESIVMWIPSIFGTCPLPPPWKSDFILGSVGARAEVPEWESDWCLVLLRKGDGSVFGSCRS